MIPLLPRVAYPVHYSLMLNRRLGWILLITVITSAGPALCKDRVVLLHGLCRTPKSMITMERALERDGFVVTNLAYPSRKASIHELSEMAIGGVLGRLNLEPGEKVHFVTHSLGGILLRSYLDRHDVPGLGRVVMLGPPNQGSEVVDKIGTWRLFTWLNGPAGSELGTASNATPNRLGPVRFELGVIAGDRSLNWINSMMIPGANDGKVSIERTKVDGMTDHIVLHVTHPYLMKRRVAIEQTLNFLKTGRFIHE